MARLLIVTDRVPWPLRNGTSIRHHHIYSALASQHETTLLTWSAGGDGAAFAEQSPLCQACRAAIVRKDGGLDGRYAFFAPGSERLRNLASSPMPDVVTRWKHRVWNSRLEDLCRNETFDAVWVARAYVAEWVRRAGFRRVIVDVDDVPSVSHRDQMTEGWYHSKPLHFAEYFKVRRWERTLGRRFARLVVCKPEDRGYFDHAAEQVRVVPNGVLPVEELSKSGERPGELLFVGTLAYEPNADACRYFSQSILPRVQSSVEGATFQIVGRNPTDDLRRLSRREGVSLSADVPEITPYYESASVVVVPLRRGSGTRLKILEALMLGKAVVTTSKGVEGLDLRHGRDLLVADDPRAFAAHCADLLVSPQRRASLGRTGRQRVLEKYTWQHVGREALNVVREVVENGSEQGGVR